MKPNKSYFKDVHPGFAINGCNYNKTALNDLGERFRGCKESYKRAIGSFILDWLNDDDCVTVQTSGSTGKPKSIKIKKVQMVNSAIATARRFELPEKTTALLCLPAGFIAGKMMLVRAMVMGWHIDLVPPQSNPLDQVFRAYDFCAMTPFQLEHSLSKVHLLKKLIVGGGAISTSLNKKLIDLPVKIYETYGMTETVTHVAVRRVNPKKNKEIARPFKVFKDVVLSQDNRGCLMIKAPMVASDLVVTNDLVKLVTHKEFVWLGRVDNVINSGGVKLYPEQIEKKLQPFIEKPFFIVGVPDELLGVRVALFVEQKESFVFKENSGAREVVNAYEFPKKIYTVTHFERTENGKIRRKNTVNKALGI